MKVALPPAARPNVRSSHSALTQHARSSLARVY